MADRVKVRGGDFFTGVPAGCGAYVFKQVLHNWGDPEAERILACVREAMAGAADSRLFIVEQIVGPSNQWDHAKLLDIDMMLRFGGAERNMEEWRRLLSASGFALVTEPRLVPGAWQVMECAPTVR